MTELVVPKSIPTGLDRGASEVDATVIKHRFGPNLNLCQLLKIKEGVATWPPNVGTVVFFMQAADNPLDEATSSLCRQNNARLSFHSH